VENALEALATVDVRWKIQDPTEIERHEFRVGCDTT
jgi:hypothetical protein